MTQGTIYLVEDEDVVRDALVWLFKSYGLRCVDYASGEAALAALLAGPVGVGCLVLDVRMDGGMSGLELFDRLHAEGLAACLPALFLTGHGTVPMAVEAVKKGAFDFFEKPFNNNRLVDRVIEALDASALHCEARQRSAEKESRLASLSSRETEVMHKILAGVLNKVIAEELGITMRTVEVHRASIFSKLGVKSAVELAQWLKG